MADAAASAPLASILTGQDPRAAELLQAVHNEQARDYVQNPGNWQNGGLFGGLARIMASGLVPNNTPVVADLASQMNAARPQQAALLAQPNPFAAIAANPSAYSPLAQAMVLNGATPENAALSQLQGAQSGLIGARVGMANGPIPTTGGSSTTAPATTLSTPAPPTVYGAGHALLSDPGQIVERANALPTQQQRQAFLMPYLSNPRLRGGILANIQARQLGASAAPVQASAPGQQFASGLPPIMPRNAP